MFNYTAYNLGISSCLPLPELHAPAEAAPDITIRFARIDWVPPTPSRDDEPPFELTPREAHFFWPRLGKFRVRNGHEITIDPSPGVEERMLRLPLLGTVLATLLHMRGLFVLHASAVGINGECVIFLGNKGWGKSTMAATLHRRGHELMADDLVALETDGRRPMALAGVPHIKLYPEVAVSSLGYHPSELTELATGYGKHGCRIVERFSQQTRPVSGVFVLAGGAVPAVTRLSAPDAVLHLIKNTYVARFGNQMLSGSDASQHLQQCARLVNTVPVYRLERPKDLPTLPHVATLVESRLSCS